VVVANKFSRRLVSIFATTVALAVMTAIMFLIAIAIGSDMPLGVVATALLVVAPLGIHSWRRDANRSWFVWGGLALMGGLVTLVFVWLDCGVGTLHWGLAGCASRQIGFSLLLTICVGTYAIVCVGGFFRMLVLRLGERFHGDASE